MSSWQSFKRHITWRIVLASLIGIVLIAGAIIGTIGSADPLLKQRVAPTVHREPGDNPYRPKYPDDPKELENYKAVVTFALIWTSIGILTGLIVRSLYLTSKDTDLWDMGNVELERTIGAYEDEQQRRKGKDFSPKKRNGIHRKEREELSSQRSAAEI